MSAPLLPKRMGIGALIGLAAGFAASLIAPKIYEARAELVLMGGGPGHAETSLGSPLATQLSLLRSEGVYREAYVAAMRKQAYTNRSPEPVQPTLSMYGLYSVDANPDSGVAVLRVRAHDPAFAANLANQIALIYQITRANANNAADKAQQRTLINRADAAKRDLDDAGNKLQAYKTQTGSPDLAQTTQQTLTYEATLQQRLNDARSEYQQTGISLATIRKSMSSISRTTQENVERAPNSEATALQNKLNDLQGQRVDLLRTFVETSSQVKAIDEQITEVQKQLASARTKPWETNGYKVMTNPQYQALVGEYNDALAHYNSLTAEISNLQKNLTGVQGEISRLPAAQHEMDRLQRTYDFALSKYNNLQDQLSQKITDGSTGAGEVTTMYATPDPTPVSPNVPFLLLLGGSLGLIGGAIYTLATKKEMRQVRTPDELERFTGLSASGVLSLPRKRKRKC